MCVETHGYYIDKLYNVYGIPPYRGIKKSTARDLATRRDTNVEKGRCSLKESTARIVATRHDARVEKGGCSLKNAARDLATRHEPARLVRPSKYKRKS